MTAVQTALGPVEDTDLGFVLSHEHVYVSAEPSYYPWRFDFDATRERTVRELKEAKAGGVDTVIDLTTPDLGRNVRAVAEASRESGVHVVVATGIWRNIPHFFWDRDPDDIADIFVREIEEGIDDTGIKPGAIKVANDADGVSPAGERVLRAAARACRRTGCPISTHQWAPLEVGRRQVEVFREEGVPMDRVCIGHSADTTDIAYLEELLNAGVYLSMDRYPGAPGRTTWEQRNEAVKALVDRGWSHRLMLGHDYAPPPVVKGHRPPAPEGPTRYLFLTTTAIPALLDAGVAEETIDEMTREVPRRFLVGEV